VPARNRALWLTLAALVLPLPAFALTGEDGAGQVETGPAGLAVSSSLGSCGVIDTGVSCQINVSFNSLPNATSYTATITSPDGSVTDLGGVSPSGTSAWVPYVGAGTYSVAVTAYGTPLDATEDDPDGKPHVIATGNSPPLSGEAEPRVPNDNTTAVQAGAAGGQNNSDNGDDVPDVDAGAADEPSCDPAPTPTTPAPETVTPAPETTTPVPDTGTTGPAEVDPGAAGKRGVATAAASVGTDTTSVAPPLVEGSSTGC
jgi:hypothetical protein